MKITALVENTPFNDSVSAEHGLSLFIETCGRKILFDMGQTELFEANAERLSVKPGDADIAVLSHGHYDHGGGLKRFLEINKKAPVYVSRYAFEPHFNGTGKYIGLDASLTENERIIFVDDELSIGEGLRLYSCNYKPREHDLGSFGLGMKQGEEIVPDDFRHEQYLLAEEKGKKILISGCSHKGVMDIVRWFKPDFLIGGFHFSKLPLDEKLVSYAEYLSGFDIEYFTCHCTGVEQFEFMSNYMKRLNYLSCGQTIEI